MRPFPTPASSSLSLLAAGLLGALGGCELGSRGSAGLPTAPERPEPAQAWVGTFRGGGAGTVGAAFVEWSDIALRIREEPDSLAEDGCDPCLELSLDTLFRAMHVRAPSDVELSVVVEGDGERQTLQLLRYSGGGGVGNVVDASLRIERGSETTLEARFLLTR